MDVLRDLFRKHKEIKQRIHNFRIPLSPTGQKFAALFYFTAPLVCGYYIFQYTTAKSAGKWGAIKDADGRVIGYKVPDSAEQRIGADIHAKTTPNEIKPIEDINGSPL